MVRWIILVDSRLCAGRSIRSPMAMAMTGRRRRRPFILSATVDFPDDIRYGPYSPRLLQDLFEGLRDIGISRVYWITYGPVDSEADFSGSLYRHMEHGAESISALGEPVRAAVRVARRLGIELFAVLKPYNTGVSWTTPIGALDDGIHGLERIGGEIVQAVPFIVRHPHLRVERRPGSDVVADARVRWIRLIKADAAPTRVTADHLQIWTSSTNHRYHRKEVPWDFRDGVEPAARDVFDYHGNLVTRAGDPVRVLTLGPLDLTDPYVVITTNVNDQNSDFTNTAVGMIEVLGPDGLLTPIVVATRSAMGRHSPRDFRAYGLEFDSGFGPQLTTLDMPVDAPGDVDSDPGSWWRRTATGGAIGFARGKNRYLPATPCEVYPEVRGLWSGWVDELVAVGVDGIDIRISHHGSLVDEPHEYGFNRPVLEEYQRRYGPVRTADEIDLARLADVRGDGFTDFMRDTARQVHNAGARLQAHIHTEAFRPDPCHGQLMGIPANVNFDWKTWLAEGLLDGATLRSSWFEALEDPTPGVTARSGLDAVLQDAVVLDALQTCSRAGVPVYLNRYIDRAVGIDEYLRDLETSFHHPEIHGFDVYETAHVLRPTSDGSGLESYRDRVALLREKAAELGVG